MVNMRWIMLMGFLGVAVQGVASDSVSGDVSDMVGEFFYKKLDQGSSAYFDWSDFRALVFMEAPLGSVSQKIRFYLKNNKGDFVRLQWWHVKQLYFIAFEWSGEYWFEEVLKTIWYSRFRKSEITATILCLQHVLINEPSEKFKMGGERRWFVVNFIKSLISDACNSHFSFKQYSKHESAGANKKVNAFTRRLLFMHKHAFSLEKMMEESPRAALCV